MIHKLLLSYGLKSLDLLGLPLELVLMASYLVPEPTILPVEVNVFLGDLGVDCLFLDLDRLLCDGLNVFSYLDQEYVDAVDQELTRLVGALHEELAAKYVSNVVMTREYNVTKLLLCPEIIKEWLADVLHHQLVK